MTPAMCRTKHDPPHSYGDCLRACIATVLDLDTEQVPHFAADGATAEQSRDAARAWLGERGLTVASFAFPGDNPLPDLMQWMHVTNPTVTWLLFGSTEWPGQPGTGGPHVVVCQGGSVVHDPSWAPTSIKQPFRAGGESIWQIWVVARV